MEITIRGNLIVGVAVDEKSIQQLVEMGFSEEEIVAAIDQQRLGEVRAERNRRIAASDWTQMPDAPLNAKQKSAWAAYRQALRDLPAQVTYLDNVEWPVVP